MEVLVPSTEVVGVTGLTIVVVAHRLADQEGPADPASWREDLEHVLVALGSDLLGVRLSLPATLWTQAGGR